MSRASAKTLTIGELSAATGVSRRLLRYYEARGLIVATRSSGGHRLYDPATVEVVGHIRDLLAAGLPTRVIGELLTCIREPGRLEPCAVPTLVEHLREFDERIASLTSTRETLAGLIASSTR
ncbi:MerR family transcriptional regulator [Saccharomonospora glauca]|uniref:Putative transcriptional regulator n=1 Tax=Saccharomonospora glauca K62 TaxID=928724 RepID=I1CXZ0_9PSEU|nr:MerR family transcriptional regulator [Saccharomonospora glauca]EIE97564.1 putative transcriptional regulator [Saccharomonospora glauca K62]